MMYNADLLGTGLKVQGGWAGKNWGWVTKFFSD